MLLTQPKVTVTQAPYPLWWGMDEEGLPEKWRQQGNALFGENDFQGAIGKYDEAIALLRRDRARPRRSVSAAKDAELVKCLTNRATACYRLERFEQCVQDCAEALGIDEAYIKAKYRRALAYKELKQYEPAAQDFEACLTRGGLDASGLQICQSFLKKFRKRQAMLAKRAVDQLKDEKLSMILLEAEQQAGAGPSDMDVSAQDAAPRPPPPIPPVIKPVPCSNVVRVSFSPAPGGAVVPAALHPSLLHSPGLIREATTTTSSSSRSRPPAQAAAAVRASRRSSSSASKAAAAAAVSMASSAANGHRQASSSSSSSVFPSRKRQLYAVRRLVRQAEASRKEAGDAYALIWAQWWKCWQEFVGWGREQEEEEEERKGGDAMEVDGEDDDDEGEEEAEEEGKAGAGGKKRRPWLGAAPPAIDNRVLLAAGGRSTGRLKAELEESVDYQVLPIEAWDALVSWYGGGPPIVRRLAVDDEDGGLAVDLYPQHHDRGAAEDDEEDDEEEEEDGQPLAAHSPPSSPTGSASPLSFCAVCRTPSHCRCSRCHQVSYCSKGCQASHWRFHRPACKENAKPVADRSRRGRAGLMNLGNTCYLNSALQCLSHTQPITMHLLTSRFKDDLNVSSPLGTGGRLVKEYEQLVKDLWLGSHSTLSPSSLRKTISRLAPQFAGNSQHDAEEVLTYLVDRLHEDLNRIKKKPYIKAPDDDDRPDSVQGSEAWHRLMQREDSVVSDNLYGQFKSQWACPLCRKASVVFDPFSLATLEIPDIHLRRMSVLLFRHVDDTSLASAQDAVPRLVTVKVSRRATVWDLKMEVAQAAGVSGDRLIMANITKHLIYDFVKDSMPVMRLRDDWGSGYSASNHNGDEASEFVLAAFETPSIRHYSFMVLLHRGLVDKEDDDDEDGPWSSSSDQDEGDGEHKAGAGSDEEQQPQIRLNGGKRRRRSRRRARESIGLPLLLVFNPDWSCRQLKEYIWMRVRPLVRLRPGEDADEVLAGLPGSLRLVMTDNEAGELEATTRRGAGSEQHDEEEEGPTPMDVDGRSTPMEEEEEEEGGTEEDKEATRRKERCVGRYLPDDDEARCGDFLEPMDGAYFVALDWEGPLDGRCGYDDVVTKRRATPRAAEPALERVTLEQCLKKFSSPERMDRENACYCTRCKKHVEAVKCLQFWRLPRILIISLKRFDSRRERKIETFVEFPVSGLDMSRYCYNPEGRRYIYDLYAVCNHYGSRSWGHYTAIARQWDESGWMDQQWYKFDDSDCEPVSESRVMTKDAYMLFYRRRGPPPPRPARPIGGSSPAADSAHAAGTAVQDEADAQE